MSRLKRANFTSFWVYLLLNQCARELPHFLLSLKSKMRFFKMVSMNLGNFCILTRVLTSDCYETLNKKGTKFSGALYLSVAIISSLSQGVAWN